MLRLNLTSLQSLTLPLSVLPTQVRVQVLKLSTEQLTSGIRDLSGGTSTGATERAVNIIRYITSAVELLGWVAPEDAGLLQTSTHTPTHTRTHTRTHTHAHTHTHTHTHC